MNWHQSIDREMPWKDTSDPYKIWVSEIILQQTRVSQGTDYYLRFIKKFPNIKSLAEAAQPEVLKVWESLGYYSRARNLQFAAQDIMNRFNGLFPTTYSDIISLKGIGPYTAAAIGSFAFNLPHAAIDGNVERVITRLYGITEPIDTKSGRDIVRDHASKLLIKDKAGAYNQAIIDFGALICKPKKPLCEACTLNTDCLAYKSDLVEELPFKSKKVKVKEKYLYYLIIRIKDDIVIQRRSQNGIWAGLYEFPVIESFKEIDENSIKDKMSWNKGVEIEKNHQTYHRLTHLKLNITFYNVQGIKDFTIKENQRLEKVTELSTFAFPKPISSFLKIEDLGNN